ncbi:hypothetical protein HYH03_013593 [Edaphochlamys debaryana]|uniref:Uncharacterized protein n=1 Tax=Edaphochlamys debaryana TaxID=47281 RepID=A0A835XRS2_9CHLO|nr:hypothetical protein HYH03_013593 [Edaphochlamys debaryana]|eukprot:KAG2487748.1 hypothetical protein HYH03_013593 [Edaphochlamys debaryana]
MSTATLRLWDSRLRHLLEAIEESDMTQATVLWDLLLKEHEMLVRFGGSGMPGFVDSVVAVRDQLDAPMREFVAREILPHILTPSSQSCGSWKGDNVNVNFNVNINVYKNVRDALIRTVREQLLDVPKSVYVALSSWCNEGNDVQGILRDMGILMQEKCGMEELQLLCREHYLIEWFQGVNDEFVAFLRKEVLGQV